MKNELHHTEKACVVNPCNGFSVGTTVFAPKYHGATVRHYKLAEITGIQSCAGTATVTFIDAEPGVDDEAVPLYALIRCPSNVLRTNTEASSHDFCSLAERVLGVAVQDGPACLTRNDAGGVARKWLFCESDSNSEAEEENKPKDVSVLLHTCTPSPSYSPPPPPPAPETHQDQLEQHQDVHCCYNYDSRWEKEKMEEENEVVKNEYNKDGEGGDCVQNCNTRGNEWRALGVVHSAPESADNLYFRAFRMVSHTLLRCLAPDGRHVVLCIFETYDTLRRFEVYMTLRGHQLHLVNGVRTARIPLAVGGEHAVSNVMWLCLLADDVADEVEAARLLKDWLPVAVLKQDLASNSVGSNLTISMVQFGETSVAHAEEDDHTKAEDLVQEEALSAAHAAVILRNAIRESVVAHLLSCQLPRDGGNDKRMATSLSAEINHHGHTVENGKVGMAAATVELCVPASSWQLHLIQALTQRGAPTEGDGSNSSVYPPSPTQLQLIAYGGIFDASLSLLFASLPCGTKPLDALREKVLHHSASFFGEEAFPLFAAVRAALGDAFRDYQTNNRARRRSPRVALVFPDTLGANGARREAGEATATATEAAAKTHLQLCQRFLQPWHLFSLAHSSPSGGLASAAGPAMVLDSAAWLEAGGVLLLHPGDGTCKFGALHHEANLVITCGKSAALWAAANVYCMNVSLLSEVEFAIDQARARIPCAMPLDRALRREKVTEMEKEILEEAVGTDWSVTGRNRTHAPRSMTTAAIFLGKFVHTPVGQDGDTHARKRQRNEAMTGWCELRRVAEQQLLHCLRAPAAVAFLHERLP